MEITRDGPRTKGYYRTTIYGEKDVVNRINAIIRDFKKLFTNDSKIADISPDD